MEERVEWRGIGGLRIDGMMARSEAVVGEVGQRAGFLQLAGSPDVFWAPTPSRTAVKRDRYLRAKLIPRPSDIDFVALCRKPEGASV